MRIIIIGCGRIGSGLAISLSKSAHAVTVIDSDPASFEKLPPSFKGKTITGIGFDQDILLQAGIEKADAVVAVTWSDETNAVIARLASRFFRVPKVIARLYDHRKADIYKRIGLQTIDTTGWGINRIIDMLSYSPLGAVLSVGNGGVEIVEIEVPQLLVGRKVSELTVPGEMAVSAITRENKSFIPTLGTEFMQRDMVTLSVDTSSSKRLKSLLGLS